MQTRKIATRALVPLATAGMAAAVPASAAADVPAHWREGHTVRITRGEFEALSRTHPDSGIGADLCEYGSLYGYYGCGHVWGAFSHAIHDALTVYSSVTYNPSSVCVETYPSAPRYIQQWVCHGGGEYHGHGYNWSIGISPYGSATSPYHVPPVYG